MVNQVWRQLRWNFLTIDYFMVNVMMNMVNDMLHRFRSMYGKSHSDTAKAVIGAATLTRKADYTCEWCDFVGTKSKQTRWHNDNCQQHPNYSGPKPASKTCQHCNLTADKGTITKHHGDKCKLNPNYVPVVKKTFKPVHKERTCPWCNLTGKGANMTRHHFDNCKQKS
jgi:hypothetical protein